MAALVVATVIVHGNANVTQAGKAIGVETVIYKHIFILVKLFWWNPSNIAWTQLRNFINLAFNILISLLIS